MEKPRKRILLVDDDLDLAELVRLRLESAGFSVSHCLNGKQALDAFHRERPHAIVLDVDMPEKNGLITLMELNEEFKSHQEAEKKPKIPILIITGLGSGTVKDMIREAGCYDFLEKPFNTSMLVEKLEKATA